MKKKIGFIGIGNMGGALARAAAACCGPQGFALQDAYADGSWTEDGRFVLAQGSDLALQRRFGKLS